MGIIVDFPQRGVGKMHCMIDEFLSKYSTTFSGRDGRKDIEENKYHFHLMKGLNISYAISFSIYIIMLVSLVGLISLSGRENINKMFGAVVLVYTIIPLSLLVWCEIERRWQLLSRKIGHN